MKTFMLNYINQVVTKMNKTTLSLVVISTLVVTISCQDLNSTINEPSDTNLIEQIENSKLTEINFNSLPSSSKSTIQNKYIPNGDTPNKSFESPSLGYKVNLVGQGRTVDVFFNTEGRELNGGDREDGGEDTEGDDDERSGDGDSGSDDGGDREDGGEDTEGDDNERSGDGDSGSDDGGDRGDS